MNRYLAIGAACLTLALAGCAAAPQRPPYVGELTGERMGDRWVVRFPPIEVVARRRDVDAPD